ncbi:nicotinate phosphoribosyltransferase [uncultured Desulfuromusa sp.]|uniref:nicotinate phosphoribosyltransferase n=1 Tax=uncultured Desulfuromusa sp. TaxID=219183 RepID=UPI002AA6D4C4|nr:nicotinate phosphoribosyltransferase [uncultured Desulfuromusa sp.]
MSLNAQDDLLIDSLLDTDLYKITMLQAFYHTSEFRTVDVEWKFACRDLKGFNLAALIPEIMRQLEHLCCLSFTDEELDYLATFPFIKVDLIEFLRIFRLDMRFVQLRPAGKDIELRFRGPLIHVTLFEIYVLAIISELHTFQHCGGFELETAEHILTGKIALLKQQGPMTGFSFADFGTRRRASKNRQKQVLLRLQRELPDYFSGTSNLHFARTLGMMPIGTMAHEWFQSWQAITRLADAQKAALEGWVHEYRGRLGIALTDCYSMDSFIRDFSDPYFIKLYDGLRHDSGSPFVWGEKAISMYQRMGIDPLTKTLVFSDSLNFPRMLEIYEYFKGRARMSFGIGTNLTNDVGIPSLDMVIKLVAVNGKPVAKISDEPGKSMCEDPEYLRYLASVYEISQE